MKRSRLAALLGLLALAIALPWLLRALGAEFYLSFATRIVVFAIAATSLNLLLGYGGMVSLGHTAFFGLGAYVTGILLSEGVLGAGAQLLATALVVGLAALVIGAVSLRTRGVYFIMITLAFAQMLFYLANSVKQYGGDEGLTIRVRSSLPFDLTLRDGVTLYFTALAVLALALLLLLRFTRSRLGRAVLALRDDEQRAEALGLPTYRVKLDAVRRRRRSGRCRRRDQRESAGLREPEPAALGAVGNAARDGDPRRRRHGVGRRARRAGAAAAAGGAVGVHEALGFLDRLDSARRRAVRAPGAGGDRRALVRTRDTGARFGNTRMNASLLDVRALCKRFGGVIATDGVDLSVQRGEIHALIGPNGAGKTTLVAQLAGQLKSDSGAVNFNGADITKLVAHQRARRGLVRSFQITRLLKSLSVRDNLAFAVQATQGHDLQRVAAGARRP